MDVRFVMVWNLVDSWHHAAFCLHRPVASYPSGIESRLKSIRYSLFVYLISEPDRSVWRHSSLSFMLLDYNDSLRRSVKLLFKTLRCFFEEHLKILIDRWCVWRMVGGSFAESRADYTCKQNGERSRLTQGRKFREPMVFVAREIAEQIARTRLPSYLKQVFTRFECFP